MTSSDRGVEPPRTGDDPTSLGFWMHQRRPQARVVRHANVNPGRSDSCRTRKRDHGRGDNAVLDHGRVDFRRTRVIRPIGVVTSKPPEPMQERRRRLDERLRAEWIAGAEEEWRKRTTSGS